MSNLKNWGIPAQHDETILNQYWVQVGSGEIYAVQIERDTDPYVLISACGPLYYKEVTTENLADWNFNNDEDLRQSLESAPDEDFALVESPYRGDDL